MIDQYSNVILPSNPTAGYTAFRSDKHVYIVKNQPVRYIQYDISKTKRNYTDKINSLLMIYIRDPKPFHASDMFSIIPSDKQNTTAKLKTLWEFYEYPKFNLTNLITNNIASILGSCVLFISLLFLCGYFLIRKKGKTNEGNKEQKIVIPQPTKETATKTSTTDTKASKVTSTKPSTTPKMKNAKVKIFNSKFKK